MATPRTRAGAFGKIDTVVFGPIMRDLSIANVKILSAGLKYDGEVMVNSLMDSKHKETKGVILEYAHEGHDFAVTIRQHNGLLTCDYCSNTDQLAVAEPRVAWCEHMHWLVTHRADAEFFAKPGRYVIPMVPTEGIYCPVHLGEAIRHPRNSLLDAVVPVKIIMGNRLVPVEGDTDPDDLDEEIILGYLKFGYISNADLRSLFSDWAMGNLDNPKYYMPTVCQGENHEKISKPLSAFAERFWPAMYSMCPPCLEDFRKLRESEEKKYEEDSPDF